MGHSELDSGGRGSFFLYYVSVIYAPTEEAGGKSKVVCKSSPLRFNGTHFLNSTLYSCNFFEITLLSRTTPYSIW